MSKAGKGVPQTFFMQQQGSTVVFVCQKGSAKTKRLRNTRLERDKGEIQRDRET